MLLEPPRYEAATTHARKNRPRLDDPNDIMPYEVLPRKHHLVE